MCSSVCMYVCTYVCDEIVKHFCFQYYLLKVLKQANRVVNFIQVKVTYIADFSPSEFLSVNRVAHRYLLVPNDINKKLQETKKWKRVYKGQSMMELLRFQLSRRNVSEWMAINKDKFDMHSGSCNKIGVGYSAFRYQSDGCTSKMGRLDCVSFGIILII